MPAAPPIPMPSADWWSDRGLAVVLVGIALTVSIWCLREWWKFEKPLRTEKRKAEIHRELQQAKLFETLSEVEPQKVQTLRVLQESVSQIHERQGEHVADCNATREKIDRVHSTVETIAIHMGVGERTAEQIRRHDQATLEQIEMNQAAIDKLNKPGRPSS